MGSHLIFFKMAFLQCVSRDEKDEASEKSEEKFALELLIPRSDFRPKKIQTSRGAITAFWFNEDKAPKTPVVLLHALFCGTGEWYKCIEHFDRPTLSIDMLGFGESERVDFSDDPVEDWVTSLREVLAQEITGNFIFCLRLKNF